MRFPFIAITLLATPALADDVPEAMLRAFNQVAREAEALLEQSGPAPAIARYARGLEGELAGYGRLHLRLGQLYQQDGQPAEAALHFRECDADERIDPLDRELICQAGWRAVTAPITLAGLPEGGKVLILEPEPFSGPLHSGQRVPLGALKVVVTSPGAPPREAVVRVKGPLTWPEDGLEPLPEAVTEAPEVVDSPDDFGTWPAFAVAGTGALLVGTGLWLGFDNQGTLEDIRSRQVAGQCPSGCGGDLRSAESTARLADGLWIGGAVAVASGALLWWLLFEDAP